MKVSADVDQNYQYDLRNMSQSRVKSSLSTYINMSNGRKRSSAIVLNTRKEYLCFHIAPLSLCRTAGVNANSAQRQAQIGNRW